MEILAIIGAFVTLTGSVFLFLGSLGLVRMPDLYNRIQAGTKASTLGTLLTLVGIGLIMPAWAGKLVILIIFVIITNPVSSHVISRAAHHAGIRLAQGSVKDALAEEPESPPSIAGSGDLSNAVNSSHNSDISPKTPQA